MIILHAIVDAPTDLSVCCPCSISFCVANRAVVSLSVCLHVRVCCSVDSLRLDCVEESRAAGSVVDRTRLRGATGSWLASRAAAQHGPGTPDMARRAGTPDMARRAGTPDMARRAGTPDMARRTGTPDIARRAGTPDMTRRAGQATPDVTRRVGQGTPDVSRRVGQATPDVTRRVTQGTTDVGRHAGQETPDAMRRRLPSAPSGIPARPGRAASAAGKVASRPGKESTVELVKTTATTEPATTAVMTKRPRPKTAPKPPMRTSSLDSSPTKTSNSAAPPPPERPAEAGKKAAAVKARRSEGPEALATRLNGFATKQPPVAPAAAVSETERHLEAYVTLPRHSQRRLGQRDVYSEFLERQRAATSESQHGGGGGGGGAGGARAGGAATRSHAQTATATESAYGKRAPGTQAARPAVRPAPVTRTAGRPTVPAQVVPRRKDSKEPARVLSPTGRRLVAPRGGGAEDKPRAIDGSRSRVCSGGGDGGARVRGSSVTSVGRCALPERVGCRQDAIDSWAAGAPPGGQSVADRLRRLDRQQTQLYETQQRWLKQTAGGGQAGGQAGGHAGGQAGGHAGGQAGGHTGGQAGGHAGGQAGGHAGGRAGGHVGGQSNGHVRDRCNGNGNIGQCKTDFVFS